MADEDVELEVVDNNKSNEETENAGNTGENVSYEEAPPKYKPNEEEEKKDEVDEVVYDKDADGRVGDLSIDKPQIALNQLSFDFMRVIFVTIIFVSIGFLIYIITSIAWIIGLFFGLGVIVGAIIEFIRYYKAKKAVANGDKQDLDKQEGVYNLDEEFNYEWKENKEDDGIYVKTDFTNRYIEEYSTDNNNESASSSITSALTNKFSRNKKRRRHVSITGSTRVYHKKNNGALMLEKRALYIFEDYKGYEIGGGLSSFTGFFISAIVQIVKIIVDTQSDTEVDWFLNIFILALITAVLACIGCIIEIELRKNNILPPNRTLYSTSNSIALHEIVSLESYSIGYHQNVKANLSKQGGKLFVQKAAIKWFQCLIGLWKLFKFIFIALYINTAFVLFIMVFIVVALQFEFAIHKESSLENLALAICIMCWICFLLGIFAIFYTSQSCPNQCCRPDRELNRLSMESRIGQKKQKCLFILFIISTVFLFLSAAMMSAVVADTYEVNIATDESQTQVDFQYLSSMLCEEIENPEYDTSTSDGDTSVSVTGDFCDDKNVGLIMCALVLLCITWYILLVAAFEWRKYDRGVFKFNLNKYVRIWRQFSAIRIGLKKSQKSFLHKLGIYDNNDKYIIIELDKTNALVLHNYLNNVVPWFATQGHDVVTKHKYDLN